MPPQSTTTRFRDLLRLILPPTAKLDPELQALLEVFHSDMSATPVEATQVRRSLVGLLTFLVAPATRTQCNCEFVRDFLVTENEWEMDWSYLPVPLSELIFDLGNHLLDGFRPDFGVGALTPESFLQRARGLTLG